MLELKTEMCGSLILDVSYAPASSESLVFRRLATITSISVITCGG